MDTWADKVREGNILRREENRMIMQDYCNKDCDGHNENCPYYDSEEECWDYEECFKDNGGIDEVLG